MRQIRDQNCFTVLKVAANRHEPMIPQRTLHSAIHCPVCNQNKIEIISSDVKKWCWIQSKKDSIRRQLWILTPAAHHVELEKLRNSSAGAYNSDRSIDRCNAHARQSGFPAMTSSRVADTRYKTRVGRRLLLAGWSLLIFSLSLPSRVMLAIIAVRTGRRLWRILDERAPCDNSAGLLPSWGETGRLRKRPNSCSAPWH